MKDVALVWKQLPEIREIVKRTADKEDCSLMMKHLSFLEQYLSAVNEAGLCENSGSSKERCKNSGWNEMEQQLFQTLAGFRNYGINLYELGEEVRDAEKIYQFVKNVQEVSLCDFHFERACVCYNLGVLYMEHSQSKKAYEEFQEAAEIFYYTYQKPEISESVKTLAYFTFFNLALCCQELSFYKEAEEHYRLAIDAQQKCVDCDGADLIRTIFQLERLYLDLYQTNKAEQLLMETLPFVDRLLVLPNDIFYMYNLYWCAVMIQKGQCENMLETIHHCYEQMETEPAPLQLLYQFLDLECKGYLELGQINKCYDVLDKIVNLERTSPDEITIDKKSIYKMKAEILDEQEKHQEAIENFQLARCEYEKEKKRDVFWEIDFLTSLSLAYTNEFCDQEAIKTARQCITLIENLSLNRQDYNFALVPVYINLGLVYLRIMEPDKAEYYFFAALNLLKQRKLPDAGCQEEVKVLINIAWMYLSMWQYEKAEYYARSVEKLLPYDKKEVSRKYWIEIFQILSVVSSKQGDARMAIEWIDNAIKLNGENPSISLCRSLCLKGIALRAKDSLTSVECHQKSLEIARELKLENSDFYLNLLMDSLGSLPAVQEEDMERFKKAVQDISVPDSYLKLVVFSCIVKNSVILGHQTDVFEYSVKAIRLYEKLVKNAIQYKNPTNIINYKRNIRLFYEVIFLRLLNLDTDRESATEYTPFFPLFHYYKIGDFYLLNQMNGQEDMEKSYRQLELELNYLNFVSGFLREKTDLEYSHKCLMEKADMEYWNAWKPEAAQTDNIVPLDEYRDFWCIDYYCPDFQWFAADVSGFAVVWKWDDPERKTLVKLGDTGRIRASISEFSSVVLQDDSTQTQEQELYRLLLLPIMKRLPHLESVHSFIICPDGPVATVPFEAVMGIQNRILYVPFIDILSGKKSSDCRQALVAGSPYITHRNPLAAGALKNSSKECSQAAGELQLAGYTVRTLYGDSGEENTVFSKENFLRCLETERNVIIHLSTHGFYLGTGETANLYVYNENTDNPYKRCGIIMNDEIQNDEYSFRQSVVWGDDILKLDMTGTRLTVLSTCMSGLGNCASGEWLTGLQRAFFIAGTENIIVSLWEVDEEATVLLMTYFYRNLKEKVPFDLALLLAKKELIQYQNGIYSTPFYWAGFIYIGKITGL